MQIVYLKELKKFSLNELSSKLNIDNDSNIIKELELAHVLKHHRPGIDIDDLVSTDDEIINNKSEEIFYFKYVGILIVGELIIIVYPKYIKNIHDDFLGTKEKIKQIFKVIDKSQNLDLNFRRQLSVSNNSLSLFLEVIKDYWGKGLYLSYENTRSINGEGVINWEHTINDSQAYIIDNKPYYFDLVTDENVVKQFDLIKEIQKIIISDISKELEHVLEFFSITPAILSDENLSNLGNIDFLIQVLEKELSRQYITDKQDTIKLLLCYLKEKNSSQSVGSVKLYGTSSFNLVWEKICQKIYKNDLFKSLKEIGLVLEQQEKLQINSQDRVAEGTKIYSIKNTKNEDIESKNILSDKILKEVVSKPIWIDKKVATNEITVDSTLLLDVLHVNNYSKKFEIYDGKYYNVKISDNKISGQPGISDITKQYLYQLAFKKLACLNNYTFDNIFIVPMDELLDDNGDGVDIASVEVGFLKEIGLENIKVVARDCQTFYDQYLNT